MNTPLLDHQINRNPRQFHEHTSDTKLNDSLHYGLSDDVSHRLDVQYLSKASLPLDQKEISGILYGTNAKPMVNLVVRSTKNFENPINVIFVIDTLLPDLYICEKAMEALGFTDSKPKTFELDFDGIKYEAVKGTQGMNYIGTSFLNKSRSKLEIDYEEMTVFLKFK